MKLDIVITNIKTFINWIQTLSSLDSSSPLIFQFLPENTLLLLFSPSEAVVSSLALNKHIYTSSVVESENDCAVWLKLSPPHLLRTLAVFSKQSLPPSSITMKLISKSQGGDSLTYYLSFQAEVSTTNIGSNPYSSHLSSHKITSIQNVHVQVLSYEQALSYKEPDIPAGLSTYVVNNPEALFSMAGKMVRFLAASQPGYISNDSNSTTRNINKYKLKLTLEKDHLLLHHYSDVATVETRIMTTYPVQGPTPQSCIVDSRLFAKALSVYLTQPEGLKIAFKPGLPLIIFAANKLFNFTYFLPTFIRTEEEFDELSSDDDIPNPVLEEEDEEDESSLSAG